MRRATAMLLLAVVLATAGGSLTAGAAAGTNTSPPLSRGLAVYEWHNAGDLSPARVWRRLTFLRANGFKTIYLELGKYLEAADQPPGTPGRRERIDALRYHIRRFVSTATSLGLSVQAVGGGPTWTGELSYLGRLLVRLVGGYNTRVRATERLQGVQLDIEPYTIEGWLDDWDTTVPEYLETIAGIVEAYEAQLAWSANRGLQLGFAIPFWFDAEGEAPGPVVFGDFEKPAAHHIIDMISHLRGAYLVVMSYRVRTDGPNGSIALARGEFEYAYGIGARCGLIVGQRYGEDAEAPETTFHSRTRRQFRLAAARITRAFARYPQFRGVSVDDVDSFMKARP